MGQQAVAPRAPAFDWNSWTPATPVHGIDDRPAGTTTTGALEAGMNAYRALHPSAALTASSGPTGTTATMGGDWSGVERWQSSIDSAGMTAGVDPDAIKAVMKLESNGDPNASGAPGVWGPMQVNSGAWGNGPWMSDPNANILKGAQILKGYLDENGGNLREALRHYHGIGSDGFTDDQQYADIVMANYAALKGGAGTATGAGFPVSGGGDINGTLAHMFGPGAAVPAWGEFNAPSANGLYGYGNQYGLNGVNHTGIDVPLAYGTQMSAPFSGRVVCSGTGNGPGTDGGGCAAFQDMSGGGAGRLEILSDDGNTALIFGHSSRAAAAPGTHLAAGSVIGWSGGENSDHVHLEARVRDASMPSGWRIVDARGVLGGYSGGWAGAAGGAAAPLSGFDLWRQWTVGGSGGANAAPTDLLSQWRAKYVGGG